MMYHIHCYWRLQNITINKGKTSMLILPLHSIFNYYVQLQASTIGSFTFHYGMPFNVYNFYVQIVIAFKCHLRVTFTLLSHSIIEFKLHNLALYAFSYFFLRRVVLIKEKITNTFNLMLIPPRSEFK